MRNEKGFTLVDLLVLLVIAGVVLTLALPNMAMARNRSKMLDTLKNLHKVATGVEAGRVEFMKGEFVAKVNQLNNIGSLSASECPWLVPEFLGKCGLRTAWGNRFSFEADALSGDVNIGAPGRTGVLEFSLTDEPLRYELRTPEDFNRGVVFRNGVMVIGPGFESGDS